MKIQIRSIKENFCIVRLHLLLLPYGFIYLKKNKKIIVYGKLQLDTLDFAILKMNLIHQMIIKISHNKFIIKVEKKMKKIEEKL